MAGHEHHANHNHNHGHGEAGWRAVLWSHIRHAVFPHGHDSVDRLDTALEASGRGMRALVWSFGVLFATAATQSVIVLVTGSVALLGDTVHNVADALTALPIGVAFVLGRRAATRRYTYGLGRAEDVAGVVVVLIMAASAAVAGAEAILRLIHPQPISHLWGVATAGIVGFAGNEIVARWRIAVGRRIGSAALVADGLHARTDGFTSLAVVVGAAGVAVGLPIADPIVGLGITIMILFVLRDAIREVARRLLDAVDPESVTVAERAAAEVDGVAAVGEVRMRWIGHSLRAEVAVTVDPRLTVEQAHRIAHEVEHALVHAIPRLTAAIVHTEPVRGAEGAHDTLAHHRSARTP
jgi:cation diffusion facilitator family transporter